MSFPSAMDMFPTEEVEGSQLAFAMMVLSGRTGAVFHSSTRGRLLGV